MSETKLLNCPFCGGEAGIDADKIGKEKKLYYAYCKNDCITQYGYYPSKESAIKAWNTRKPMERILERLDKSYNYYVERRKEAYYDADWEAFDRFCFINRGIFEATCAVKEEGGIE